MFWILTFAGILVTLVVILIALALFSPDAYQSSVDLFIKCSRQKVWAAIQDVQRHPVSARLAREITPIESDDGLPVWREKMSGGSFTVRTVEARPHDYLKRTCADEYFPMCAEIEINLADAPGGCRIAASNRITIKRGSVQAGMMRLTLRLTDALERGLKEYFQQMSEALETEPRFHGKGSKPDLPR